MKIKSPNKDYTGVSASVPFCNGVGETEDPYLIQWFKDHGYNDCRKTNYPYQQTLYQLLIANHHS